MITNQPRLPLPDHGADWKLDDRTREVGRRGLADARAALALAARRAAERDAARLTEGITQRSAA